MNEAIWRLGIFGGVFLAMAAFEALWPRRPRVASLGYRWLGNWGLVLLDTALLRVVFPMAAVGMAAYTVQQGWGLLPALGAPGWLAFLVTLIVLDLSVYGQHVLFHAVPWLWRFHKVHHADVDLDVTSGFRFHPGEALISMALKGVVILALGPPVVAVLVFEVLLNACAMFNHSNVRIPERVDRYLRWVVVTPDMHRVHHSTIRRESNTNFGFNLPWWDRLFRTYTAQPQDGHEGMRIGLEEYYDNRRQSLWWLLTLPFRSRPTAAPMSVQAPRDSDAPVAGNGSPLP